MTSFRPGETGGYRLSLAQSPGHPRQIGVQGGRCVIALLVGVSDYGGRTSDLANTDADAREFYNSLGAAGTRVAAAMPPPAPVRQPMPVSHAKEWAARPAKP